MHNRAGEIAGKKLPDHDTVCTFPWNAFVTFWNGAVLPCTQDFFGHYIVGNVQDASLKDIWNNKKMKELRKKFSSRRAMELKACSNCNRLKRKGIFGVPKEYLWKFLTKRMP